MALEYALDVPKSFWLNLQANYDAELLDFYENTTITEGEIEAYASLKEVIKYLRNCGAIPMGQNKNDTILSLRKALQISNIYNLKNLVTNGAFSVSKCTSVNPFVMGAWLRLCQIAGEKAIIHSRFDAASIPAMIAELKGIMTDECSNVQDSLLSVFAKYGIKFSVVKNFPGAPVHGYISQDKEGIYQLALTIRGAYADIFWFSLFHEIGHIVNGDVSKTTKYIDSLESSDERKEIAADRFACNVLLDPAEYDAFISKGDFSISAIKKMAAQQNVMPYIVIGRLQKEKRIPYSRYSSHKVRYKWDLS